MSDGIPVHRRTLMCTTGDTGRTAAITKCSRAVGDVIKYHPHDVAIYDTLVRMVQPWSTRYLLVDGQGNFGSPGDDPPAAGVIYQKAALAPLAMELVRDIDKDTVDFVPNYDGKT